EERLFRTVLRVHFSSSVIEDHDSPTPRGSPATAVIGSRISSFVRRPASGAAAVRPLKADRKPDSHHSRDKSDATTPPVKRVMPTIAMKLSNLPRFRSDSGIPNARSQNHTAAPGGSFFNVAAFHTVAD